MNVIYDAGMLISLARGDRQSWARHQMRLRVRTTPLTTAPVVAQVSRDGRQALLRRALDDCEVVSFLAASAHAVGALLGAAGTSDVVDAHVMTIASELDATVITGDTKDLLLLAPHVSGAVEVVPI